MDAQEAIALLRANPPHRQSPLPWQDCNSDVLAADASRVCDATFFDAAHIAAAVNAAPVLAAEVERLNADLATLRERLRWIPVGERLPDVGIDIAAWNGNAQDGWLHPLGQFYDIGGRHLHSVTHWRQIDAPEVPPC